MLLGKKIVVVLPAYNAANTLEKTILEIDGNIVDDILLVDDFSMDETIRIAKELNLITKEHSQNMGYGGNQKTCYTEALNLNADIIIMLHPDYQYTPKLIPALASMVVNEVYDIVLASRILGGKAISGGMPIYKYFFNRILTMFENLMTGLKLSEYHTGYRVFTKESLMKLNYQSFSDDFIFDNQIIIQSHFLNLKIGEISCPTKYFKEASSISLYRSFVYGMGCLKYSMQYLLLRTRLYNCKIFKV